MSKIDFSKIQTHHIEAAFKKIDEEGIAEGRKSSFYDIEYQGKFYPPKLITSIAYQDATGFELKPNEFEGGIGHPSFKMLEAFGFQIVEKSSKSGSSAKGFNSIALRSAVIAES